MREGAHVQHASSFAVVQHGGGHAACKGRAGGLGLGLGLGLELGLGSGLGRRARSRG